MPFRPLIPVALSGIVAMATAALTTDPSAQAPRILVAALAHADDEGPIAPVLARYAREGAQVYMLVVSDGSAGSPSTQRTLVSAPPVCALGRGRFEGTASIVTSSSPVSMGSNRATTRASTACPG